MPISHFVSEFANSSFFTTCLQVANLNRNNHKPRRFIRYYVVTFRIMKWNLLTETDKNTWNNLTYICAISLASSCNICSLQRRPFLSSVVSKRALKNMIWYKLMLLIKFFHLKPSLCNATTIVGRSQECCSNVLHLSHFKAHFSLLKKSKYFVVKTFHEKSGLHFSIQL